MEKKLTKSEAELIATVANIVDPDACLRFAQRAKDRGMLALAAACEEHAKTLGPVKKLGTRKLSMSPSVATIVPMKTHVVAEEALTILEADYRANLPPTTYGQLARRCGFEGQNIRWFGQVTDLIDAACALAGVPSFALVRVLEANGNINHAAWRKGYEHLRDAIIAKAQAGIWTDNDSDFTKIRDALALFSAHALGNKKAWDYVITQIDINKWAGATG